MMRFFLFVFSMYRKYVVEIEALMRMMSKVVKSRPELL